MKTIAIIFFGLMVHVNQPGSLDNTVVIPHVDGHIPQLRIPENAVRNPADPWLMPFFKPMKHEYVIELKGFKVRVEETRGIFSDKHPTFFAAAPRLGELAPNCKLRPEVRSRQVVADLDAFVDYRSGRLTVHEYFPDALRFPSGPLAGDHCVACTTRYEADLDGDHADLVFTVGNTSHTVAIEGNSQLVVSNVPPSGTGLGHFKHNYAIFSGGCVGYLPSGTADCKSTPLCKLQVVAPFPDSDCTNTNYP